MATSEFCIRRGIASGSFYAWRKDEELYGKYSKNLKFVEIKPQESPLTNNTKATGYQPVAPIFASLLLGAFELDIHQQVDA